MLVLMRKRSEAIMIGEDIVMRILGITPQQVRIGVDAPKEVVIDREEIYLKKKGIFVPGSYVDDAHDDEIVYCQNSNYLSVGENA